MSLRSDLIGLARRFPVGGNEHRQILALVSEAPTEKVASFKIENFVDRGVVSVFDKAKDRAGKAIARPLEASGYSITSLAVELGERSDVQIVVTVEPWEDEADPEIPHEIVQKALGLPKGKVVWVYGMIRLSWAFLLPT